MVADEKKESNNLIEKKYEFVPPDGGWGYLVAVAAIICFSTTTAFAGSFGMLYNDFITEVNMSSASVTLLLGIFCVAIALAGFFTAALLTIMSLRMLAFVASVIFSLGCFGTAIMTNTFMFFLFAGIMQGAGLGILYNLACTIMNDYFVEKRMLVMSFVQTAAGFLTMLAPMFVQWSLEQFGSKGTLLVIGGISLNNFLAVFMMQPVKWHMKKVEVPEKYDLKLLLEADNEEKKVTTPIVKITDLEENITKDPLDFSEKKSGVRKVLESLIDTSLIKTYVFSGAALGPTMSVAADGIFAVMLPQYLYSLEWSQENVAMAISLYGFGDLAMRVIFTFVSKWMFKLGVQEIYIMGVAVAVFSRFGMLWSNSVTAIMVFFTFMGVAHCSIAVLYPVVISDSVVPEKFTSAMGICLLLNGILSIALGPAVGAVRDITNSYSTAFYTVTSFYILVAILWSIELFVKKNKLRRKNKETKSKSSQSNKVPE